MSCCLRWRTEPLGLLRLLFSDGNAISYNVQKEKRRVGAEILYGGVFLPTCAHAAVQNLLSLHEIDSDACLIVLYQTPSRALTPGHL